MVMHAPACGDCCCPITGTFSVVSGTANVAVDPITATGPAEILYSGAPADEDQPIKATLTIRTDDDPAQMQLRLARVDGNEYLFAEVAVSTGTVSVRLGKREGGASEWLIDAVEVVGADLTDETVIALCWTPGEPQDEVELEQGRRPRQADDEANGWTDPTNIFSDDGLEATTTPTTDSSTDALLGWDFGFTIPAGSVITGVEFGVGAEYEQDGGTVQDAAMSFSYPGDSSDNMAAGTQVPDDGSGGSIAYGGAGDLSGVTPDWQDVSDEDFTFRMVYAAIGSVGSDPLAVDWVIGTIYYTTPPKTPGTLRLFVDGNCVASAQVPWLGTGTGVTIAAVVGDWEWSEFELTYLKSATRTTCPECPCTLACSFSDCGSVPETFSVAFNPGWTDNNCVDCDEFDGTYLVDYSLAHQHFYARCAWFLQDLSAGCGLLGGQRGITILILALAGDIRMTITAAGGYGIYEASGLSGSDCLGAIVLTLVDSLVGIGCVGAWPASITIDGSP